MKILLADDDAAVRSALRLLLEHARGIVVVGECSATHDLVAMVLSTQADLVVIDWDLPNLRASGAVELLRAARQECQLVALSGRPEGRADALRSGAVRFVSKCDPPESLLAALSDCASLSEVAAD